MYKTLIYNLKVKLMQARKINYGTGEFRPQIRIFKKLSDFAMLILWFLAFVNSYKATNKKKLRSLNIL